MGQVTVEVVRKGKRIKFVIQGEIVFLEERGGFVQVDVLLFLDTVEEADSESVGVRTPFVPYVEA